MATLLDDPSPAVVAATVQAFGKIGPAAVGDEIPMQRPGERQSRGAGSRCSVRHSNGEAHHFPPHYMVDDASRKHQGSGFR
jgi:hypothetical protein